MTKRKNRVSGVYSLTNLVNRKRYIGLSVSIYDRWDNHRGYLRNNNHVNQYLQNAWNKYGESNFQFEILERCGEYELEERELYWIDKFDSCKEGYNILYGAGDYSNLTYFNSEKQNKIFYVFNRYTREFLGEFEDVNRVINIFDISYQGIVNTLRQKTKYTSAFELIYKEDYEKNEGRLFSEVNRPKWDKGYYIVDLMTGECRHFYHINHGATYFGIPNENQISVRIGEFNNNPVWDQYYIGNYHHFHSYGSVDDIVDKHARILYAADCDLEKNLY